MPTEKIEIKKFAGKDVFSVREGDLLICLENEVTKELIDAVVEAKPLHFFCLDSAFKGNDQLKANTVQTFSARNQGPENENQIVFKTI
jgi:adenine-specific DNA-methyltransferase